MIRRGRLSSRVSATCSSARWALAAEYQKLKYELADRYRFDREAYTDAKGPFVERVLKDRRRGM
jgi:hypothetical protein